MKHHKSSLKRTGKFFLKLALAMTMLKLFLFISRFSNPDFLTAIYYKLDWTIATLLFFGIVMYYPYDVTIARIREFFHNHPLKSEEEYARIAVRYSFEFLIMVYATFLLISRFYEIGFNFHYLVPAILINGILLLIFRRKI